MHRRERRERTESSWPPPASPSFPDRSIRRPSAIWIDRRAPRSVRSRDRRVLENPAKQAALHPRRTRGDAARGVPARSCDVEVDVVRRPARPTMRRRAGACAIVRGIRSAADLDYERQMARMNRHLAPAIDTMFLAPSAAVRPHQLDAGPGNRRRLGGSVQRTRARAVEAVVARTRCTASPRTQHV